MNVQGLITKLERLDPEMPVHVWDPLNDTETAEVYVVEMGDSILITNTSS